MNHRLFYLLLALNLLVINTAKAQSTAKFMPPEGQVLLFIGQDQATIENYIKSIQIVPAGFMVYTSVQKMDGLYSPVDYGSGNQYSQYFVERYPQSMMQIGLYMVGALEGVLNGDYDKNLAKLSRWILDFKRPVFLRIGYEFDSPPNNYDPGLYGSAFRYIVEFLRRKQVENVAFVWHSDGGLHERSAMEWYPGDNFVDWVGLSYFNPYNTDNMDKIVRLAQQLNKPLMLAEATPVKMKTSNGEQTWNRWFKFVFRYINDNNIKAFCYINSHWDPMPMFAHMQWGDARIETNEFIKNQWVARITSGQFLNASDNL